MNFHFFFLTGPCIQRGALKAVLCAIMLGGDGAYALAAESIDPEFTSEITKGSRVPRVISMEIRGPIRGVPGQVPYKTIQAILEAPKIFESSDPKAIESMIEQIRTSVASKEKPVRNTFRDRGDLYLHLLMRGDDPQKIACILFSGIAVDGKPWVIVLPRDTTKSIGYSRTLADWLGGQSFTLRAPLW